MFHDDGNNKQNPPGASGENGEGFVNDRNQEQPDAEASGEGQRSAKARADAFLSSMQQNAQGQTPNGNTQPMAGQPNGAMYSGQYQTTGVPRAPGQAQPASQYGQQPQTQQATAQRPYHQMPYAAARPVQNTYQYPPQPPKKKTAAILGIIFSILGCVLIGAIVSVYVIFPKLQEQSSSGGRGNPSQTTSPESSTTKPEEYRPDEDVSGIGGKAPDISDSYNPVPEIAKELSPSVVGVNSNVMSEGKTVPYARGTGFVIHEDGYILTNYHVIEGGASFTIEMEDGTEYDAKYVGGDAGSDIAVLKVDGANLTPVALGNSDETLVGELVVAVGNPSGAGENLTGTVTVGYISAVERELVFNGSTQLFLQTDAAVNPGNSGGPLVNSKGEVIGVVTLKSLVSSMDEYGSPITAEGIGFAIPINRARSIALDIINNGSVKRPGIGIEYRDITEEEAAEEGTRAGMYVAALTQGGPAEKAGIQVGDIIIKCNGTSIVENSGVLSEAISGGSIGDKIKLTVWRNGKEVDIDVELGDLNALT